MRRRWYGWLVAAWVAGLWMIRPPGAAAQNTAEAEDALRLEDVVVTAPAVIEGNVVNDYASQVTVVTQEQIRDLNAQDLPSALRRTPGVIISRHNPIGSFGGGEGGTIFIRGHGASRPGAEIVMLVDGIPKFVSVWTHPLMDVLSVDNIARMDVYKGAQPVLFGNMAFAAVDMTTKRMTREGVTTRFEGAFGSYDTVIGKVEHGGKVDRLDYYLLGSYRRSDGHREDADGELKNFYGRVGYALSSNWDLSLSYTQTDNWADDPGSTDPTVPSDGRFNTEDYFTVATLSNRLEWGEGHIKLYWDKGDIDWEDQDETPGLNTLTDYQNYGVRARETLRPWQDGEVLAGVDLDYISGEVDFENPSAADQHFPEETWRMTAPYLAVNHTFGSRESWYAVPSAGVRYIDHSEFDNEWGPQAGMILGFKGTEFHASYARGINYPGIFVKVQEDVFMPGQNQWEDLKAETLDHYEIGIAGRFGATLEADLTWFHDEGENRIVVSPPPPFPPVLTNIGQYTIRGAEATLAWSPIREFSFFAGATYLDADPADLPYTPEWTFSSGLNYRFLERFQLSVDAQYVDEHFVVSRSRTEDTVNTLQVDSYFLINGKLTYDFILPYGGLRCRAYVAGENLTDTEYQMKKGYPMPGINGMIGMSVRF